MRGRKMMMLAAVGILALAALVAVLLVAAGGSSHHASSAGPTPTVTPAPPFTPGAAAALAASLAAGNDASLRKAVAIPARQQLDPHAAAELRALTPISFDLATFRASDATNATVDGVIAHPRVRQTARWTFMLVYVDGRWKLLDAEPAT